MKYEPPFDLDACPFCDNRLNFSHGKENGEFHVYCDYCGCSGPLGLNEISAALLWNVRGGDVYTAAVPPGRVPPPN